MRQMLNINECNPDMNFQLQNSDDQIQNATAKQSNLGQQLNTQSTFESINIEIQNNNTNNENNKEQKQQSGYNLRERNKEFVADQNQMKKNNEQLSSNSYQNLPNANNSNSFLQESDSKLNTIQEQNQEEFQQEHQPYITNLLDFFPELEEGIKDSQLDEFVQNLRSENISQQMGTVWVIRTGKKEDVTPNILHFSCKINQFKLCSSSFKLKKNTTTGLFQLFKEEKLHSHARFTQKEIERKLKFVGQLRRTKRNKKYKTKQKSQERLSNQIQQFESSSQTSINSHHQDIQNEDKQQKNSKYMQNDEDIFENMVEQSKNNNSQANISSNNTDIYPFEISSLKCINTQSSQIFGKSYSQNNNQQPYIFKQSASLGNIPQDLTFLQDFNKNNQQNSYQQLNKFNQISIQSNNNIHEQNYQNQWNDSQIQNQQIQQQQIQQQQQQQVIQNQNQIYQQEYQNQNQGQQNYPQFKQQSQQYQQQSFNQQQQEDFDGEDIFFSKDNKPRY